MYSVAVTVCDDVVLVVEVLFEVVIVTVFVIVTNEVNVDVTVDAAESVLLFELP